MFLKPSSRTECERKNEKGPQGNDEAVQGVQKQEGNEENNELLKEGRKQWKTRETIRVIKS